MDFSRLQPPERQTNVGGSFACQECSEVVLKGLLDEDTGELLYWCPNGHESSIKLR